MGNRGGESVVETGSGGNKMDDCESDGPARGSGGKKGPEGEKVGVRYVSEDSGFLSLGVRPVLEMSCR